MATTATRPSVAILPFHTAIVQAIAKGEKAMASVKATIEMQIRGRYAETMPVYAEYDADTQAFKALAEKAGKADAQYYQRIYCGFLVDIYGALPVSIDDAAQKKRVQRIKAAPAHVQAAYHAAEAEAKAQGKQEHEIVALAARAAQLAKKPKEAGANSAGAPKNTPKPQVATMEEGLEQMIARVGVCDVLAAVNKILAADKSTKLQASAIAALIGELRKKLQPGKMN